MTTFKFLTNEYLSQVQKLRMAALQSLRFKVGMTVAPEYVGILSHVLGEAASDRYVVCNAYGDEIAMFPYTFPGLNDAIDYIIDRHKNGNHRGDWIMNPNGVDGSDDPDERQNPTGLTQEETEYIEMFGEHTGM